MSRSILTRIILALALSVGVAACGSDDPSGDGTPDAGGEDVVGEPDISGDPDVSGDPDATEPEPDATEPEPDATEPDPDVTEPDPDVTEPDPDVTEPDPDVTEPDPDVTEPDPDVTEPDPDVTEPASDLGGIVGEFAGQGDDHQTTPDLTLEGLVVTLVKPDAGNELGGFFVVDESGDSAIYFAPEDGVADLPGDLEAGSIIDVHIDEVALVQGMIMVTAYSDLTIVDEVDSLDDYQSDFSQNTVAQFEGSQSAFIELSGIIEDESAAAGGGVWRRFPITTDGIDSPDDSVELRLTSDAIDYFGIEEECAFTLSGGAVWAYGSAPDHIQYQPMFIDQDQFLVVCEAPKLESAEAADTDSVKLKFSRPMDETTIDTDSFELDPDVDVLDVEISSDLKTLTLTTDELGSAEYTVTVADTVLDTTGEPVDPDHAEAVFDASSPVYQAVLYCFEDDDGDPTKAPTVVAQGFTDVSDMERAGGVNTTTPKGNDKSAPAECLGSDKNKAFNSNTWSEETTFDVNSDAYYTFSFKAPEGTAYIRFDAHRSGTGPEQLAIWSSITGDTIAEDVDVPTNFGDHPMFPPSGESYVIDIPASQSDEVEVRIYPYNTSGSGGTFRIDNLEVLFSPAAP